MINECCRNFFCLTTFFAINFFDVLLCEPGSSPAGAPGGPGRLKVATPSASVRLGSELMGHESSGGPLRTPFFSQKRIPWPSSHVVKRRPWRWSRRPQRPQRGARQGCCFFGTALPRSKYPSGVYREPSTLPWSPIPG